MPYQLRRIIAINIRNSKTRVPSGRVAELDPRGGVLAIGDNGVGKTTFLRLLPVFYGATTSQILRGTGRDSLINYLLPDPSSCVVYEYERESENDLRCVVMHCQSNADAAEFRFIHAGFQEDFFFNDNNQFVLRDELPRRVEEKGFEITRKLTLSQYRSVILNERNSTRESVDMRRLAARYSLGPKSLANLEQIAAAMANEKINFRDLQNVVIELVTDARAETAGADQNRRELKKSRHDVVQWLEAHDHMVDVSRAAPEAERLQMHVDCVKRLDLELSGLRVVVKAAIAKVEQEKTDLISKKESRIEEGQISEKSLNAAIEKLDDEIPALEITAANAKSKITAATARQNYFASYGGLGIEAYAEEDVKEPSYKSKKESKEAELYALNEASGSLNERKIKRLLNIETEHGNVEKRINSEREKGVRQHDDQLESLRERQREEEETLPVPDRLSKIPGEVSNLNQQIGECKATIANPVASKDAHTAQSEAIEEVKRVRGEHTTAGIAASQAQATERVCQRDAELAVQRNDQLSQHIQEIDNAIKSLSAKLDPPPGSLLAFLRGADTALWSDTAKIIDPRLLERQDLGPFWNEKGTNDFLGADYADVGGISLRASQLETPDWVDMKGLRAQITQAQSSRSEMVALQAAASSIASAASRALSAAKDARQKAEAQKSLMDAALVNVEENLGRAEHVCEREKSGSKDEAQRSFLILNARIEDLNTEQRALSEGAAKQLKMLRDQFELQGKTLRKNHDADIKRLDDEQEEASKRKKDQIKALEADAIREMKGLGLDPERVNRLEEEIADLAGALATIAGNRYEVDEWRKFSAKIVPFLPQWQADAESAKELEQRGKGKRSTHQQALEALGNALRLELKQIDGQILSRDEELLILRSLRDTALAIFVAPAPAVLDVDWFAQNLKDTVEKTKVKLESETQKIQDKHRALRNLMLSKTGGVEQWVTQREKELPDAQILTAHIAICEKARILIDWYSPTEYGPYVDALNREMSGFMDLASSFVGEMDGFDRRIENFNKKLQDALKETARFEHFRDLSVTVRSGVNKLGYLNVLRKMSDIALSRQSSWRSYAVADRELPAAEHVMLVREFKDILPTDGRVKVNLSEHVRLECSLVEGGQARVITNQDEFQAVSSNGNTALIIAMFLMGFVQMIRGKDSGIRLTWISDEVGRFDAKNLASFLQTLGDHQIDVISASPSVDPALAQQFKRLSYFENSGAIVTTDISDEELYVQD